MYDGDLVVLKFGSSIFQDHRSMPLAVDEISRHLRAGEKVIAVVSALAGVTDHLLQTIYEIDPDVADELVAEYVCTGERQSALLLTAALHRSGRTASMVKPHDISLVATGDVLDSDPVALEVNQLLAYLTQWDVIVIPGFVAQNELGDTVLLGRGGSDDTALFIASQMRARCRLVKDVDGIYEWDPAAAGPAPKQFSQIHWSEALNVANELVQDKAIKFAQEQSMSFEVTSLGGRYGTLVGPGPSAFYECALTA